MKSNFIKLCAFGLGALTFFGCQEDEDALVMESMSTQKAYAENCDVIDFNQYNTGFRNEVHSVKGMGPVKLMNKARTSAGELVDENRAMIFDMANPTGDDTDDLFHPGLGKGLIINHLGTSVPNDNQWGGTMEVDFSAIGPVTINTATVVDVDTYEDASYIYLYNAAGEQVGEYSLKPIGNASVQTAMLNVDNVMKMKLMMAGTSGHVGSGALDNIEFCVMPKVVEPEPEEMGCTRTQGYWKTHGEPGSKKYNSTWDPYVGKTFFKSGMTYMGVLNEPVKGRAYLILAHQYIATMLNVEAGASIPSNVKAVYDQATAYFETASIMKNDPMHSQLTTWAGILDDYNNGKIGPGHCD